jgi:hypothetical protein
MVNLLGGWDVPTGVQQAQKKPGRSRLMDEPVGTSSTAKYTVKSLSGARFVKNRARESLASNQMASNVSGMNEVARRHQA